MKQTPKRARRRDEGQASAVFLSELATGLLLYAPWLILPFCVDWSGQILRAVTSACCFYVAWCIFNCTQDDSTHADSPVLARTPRRRVPKVSIFSSVFSWGSLGIRAHPDAPCHPQDRVCFAPWGKVHPHFACSAHLHAAHPTPHCIPHRPSP